MPNECACIYVDTEFDSYGFSNRRIRKARKEHKCCECGRMIMKDEQYELVAGNWYDCWEHYKTCYDCTVIRDFFFCDGYYFTEMKERMQEHISDFRGEIAEDCLSVLTPGGRGWLCEIIEEYWEDTKSD